MPFVWVLFYIYMECDENSHREICEYVGYSFVNGCAGGEGPFSLPSTCKAMQCRLELAKCVMCNVQLCGGKCEGGGGGGYFIPNLEEKFARRSLRGLWTE
jgi:hypothetical protein